MNPAQLERIKQYIGKAEYSGGYIFRSKPFDEYGVGYLCNVVNHPKDVGQFITDAINEKLERMKDPLEIPGSKIYIENVRQVRGITTDEAKAHCESLVAAGRWTKHFGIKCRNCNRIIESVGYLDLVPISITCKLCDGEDDFKFKPGARDVIIYYINTTHTKNG